MHLRLSLAESDARRLFFGLLTIELLLVAAYALTLFSEPPRETLAQLFDLDGESNVPAWFSSAQLFAIGAGLLLATRREAPVAPSQRFLLLTALAFLFFSLDEAAMIHEKVGGALGKPDWLPSFRGKRGFWIPIYAGAGLGVVAILCRDLLDLWVHARRELLWVVAGVSIYVLGAVGMEILAFEYLFDARDPSRVGLYNLEVVAEEFLEMSGASLVLYGVCLLLLRPGSPSAPRA